MRKMRALVAALAIVALASGLSGCGSSSPKSTDGPVRVDITFKDGTVSPVGERVSAGVGQEIDLEITADEAGQIHVHSDPEQELSYEAGTQTITVKINRPGLIDVESHELDQVILKLAVQ